MSEETDNVRVDLLKFRRKAYLSYPENSTERKKFLKTILENELRITEQEVPLDLINHLIEGDVAVLQDSIKQFFLWLILSIFCIIGFASIHLRESYLLLICGGVSLGIALHYLHAYWRYRKSTQIVKDYFNDMKKYMNKISNDIKRLEGPRGF